MPKLRVSRSLHSLLFLLTLSLVAATPAAAGDGIWTPLGPDGAQITALAAAPSDPDVVYAGTQRSGVYKSLDGGATWGFAGRGVGTEQVSAFAVDPRDSGTVYAASGGGSVFKTTDGAATWVRVWTGAPASGVIVPTWTLAIDARRPRTLFAGTREGLFRSTDAGATWVRRGNLVGSFRSLAYDAAGGWLYAGVDGQGIFRSFNQGTTWERINTGLPSSAFHLSLAFDPDRPRTLLVTTPQGVYRSLDRGGRWQRIGSLPDEYPNAVVFQRHGRAYAAFLSGMFYSADSGASWRRSANLPGRNGGDLRTLAAGPDLVYIGLLGDSDGPGLYRSLDEGATWQPAAQGIQALAVTEVAVHPADGRTIYAAVAFNSLYKTTDGGATWTRIAPLAGGGLYIINDIVIDPARPATIWLTGGTAPPLLRSDDAGATWRPVGEPGLAFRSLAIDPRAPDALWGAGESGLFHSTDGGVTWEPQDLGANDSPHVAQVQVDPRNPDVVYASGAVVVGPRVPTFEPRFFRSADGGVTWERRDAGLAGGSVVDFAVDAADPSTLYAVTGRLFRSTDAGLSWTPAPDLAGFVYLTVATAPAGPGTPAAVYTARQFPGGLVLRSTDQGETWTPLRRGLPPAVPRVLEVDPANPSHLLLGTENRSLMTYTLGGAQ